MARELPKIDYKGKSYYFDERLSELRDTKTAESFPIRRSESELINYALKSTDARRPRLVKANMKDLEEQGKIPEYTDRGCVIKRSFSEKYAHTGNELNYFADLSAEGYEELYYEAPYHWGKINIHAKKIITYTEGDVYDIRCPDKESFYKEAKAHIDFMKDQTSESAYGEWPDVEARIKKLID